MTKFINEPSKEAKRAVLNLIWHTSLPIILEKQANEEKKGKEDKAS